MKRILLIFARLLLTSLAELNAAEHAVGPGGFTTIAEGVAALKPGDTLTIMPGEYRETVSATLVGTAEAPITIRAWGAGSVLLRGDVDLNNFQPAPGLRHVFVTEKKQRAESVFERSTFRTLEPKLSAAEVELALMSYFHDEKNGRLYVHTSDSLLPMEAFASLGEGIIPVNLIIEAAKEAGAQYCHVEQDLSKDPIDSIRRSLSYLRS